MLRTNCKQKGKTMGEGIKLNTKNAAIYIAIAAVIVISLVVSISGCGYENTEDQSETNRLADEEVDSIYQKALKIYYWFDVGTLPADMERKTLVEGRTYYKVTGEPTEFQHLIDMMDSVFDGEIVEDLLSRNMYIDVDGDLYGVLADRGTDIDKGKATYETIRKGDREIVYRARVELLDEKREVFEYEIHDFHMRLYDDGKWRFDEFYLFR